MKQVLQSLRDGETEIAEVPTPMLRDGCLLIRTYQSLISAGTERMLVEFGKAGLINKAMQQPERLRLVIDKLKTDGLVPTVESVLSKLDTPIPLGYCNIGEVVGIGSGVSGYEVGDRVISNGHHAEVVCVPENLCAKVPENVTNDDALFTVIASVALQGVRLIHPTIGETIVVSGLGTVGLITIQLLVANGCNVIGMDYDKGRLELAEKYGADTVDLSENIDPVKFALRRSNNFGVDGVIITASTNSSDPVSKAAQMCRKRGRIVLVGVTGLQLNRSEFYEKELTFQVSCSYGPGRYESNYEDKGLDFPIGYVRWTEQRNFESILELMKKERLNMGDLISHRFSLEDSVYAYEVLTSNESSLGIILEYEKVSSKLGSVKKNVVFDNATSLPHDADKPNAAFIGAGNYALKKLIPAFKSTGVTLKSVLSMSGVSSYQAYKKFEFEDITSNVEDIYSNPAVNVVVISTRHDTHAKYVCEALESGKHVFVEKPLCINLEDIEKIRKARSNSNSKLMIGFNRRFSPHVIKIKSLLREIVEPKTIVMTINAGEISSNHWVQDPKVGGGRIIGEICHFVDLLKFLCDARVVTFQIAEMQGRSRDTVSIQLQFDDGSLGVINYFSNGNNSLSKERLEVYASGKVLLLDNYRSITGYGWKGFRKMRAWRQDKGQSKCVEEFVKSIQAGTESPIEFEDLIETSEICIELTNELNRNRGVRV